MLFKSHANTLQMIQYSQYKKQQFVQEIESWKRLIVFMQQEYIFLKTQLTDIIRNDTENKILPQAELFQSFFISEESAIANLKKDIGKQEENINRASFMDKFHLDEIVAVQKSGRQKIEDLERKLVKLKFEFNNYFSEIL